MGNLQKDFNDLVDEVTKLLANQGRKLGVVEYSSKPGRAYMFKAPKDFAWVHLKTRLDCLRVGTEQKLAAKAKVDCDGYKKPHSAHNHPGYHWDIAAGNNPKLLKIARYLAQVCKERHSSLNT